MANKYFLYPSTSHILYTMTDAPHDLFKTTFEKSRETAASLYLKWMHKHNLLDLFTTPATIHEIFFKNKWANSAQTIFERILDFLISMKILKEAGGTYIKGSNYDDLSQKLLTLEHSKMDPTHNFIEYALEIFDKKIDGDEIFWQKSAYYLFERGLTQAVYKHVMDILRVDLNKSVEENGVRTSHLLIIGIYNNTCIDILAQNPINFQTLDIATFNEKLCAINKSYCELTDKNSHLTEHNTCIENLDMSKTYDVIVVRNGIGYSLPYKELIKIISNLSHEGTNVYGMLTSKPEWQFGFEPMLSIHERYIDYPTNDNFNRHMKSNKFEEIKRVTGCEMIFKTRKRFG